LDNPLKLNIFDCIVIAARLILGSVFLLSGFLKAHDIQNFSNTIISTALIDQRFAYSAANIVIFVELIIGSSLIIGCNLLKMLWASMGLLAVFTILILSSLLGAINLKSCGCFGRISTHDLSYFELIRNLLLIILNLLALKLKPRATRSNNLKPGKSKA
jgi:uncharacterized membrane protein YphA (DoxX/SURF4 family)